VNAAHMVAEGLCDVLASDYYYPAQLVAAFRLERDGVLTLAEAWKLVSEHAAHAAGLADRGRIEDGLRADLVLIDPAGDLPHAVATATAGHLRGSWQRLVRH